MSAASIGDRELSTAPPTSEDAGQEGRSLLGRTWLVCTQTVAGNHFLNLLKLLPIDVAFVMVLDE